MRSGLLHRRRESESVVSTAPLPETATDPNGEINTFVKKNIVTTLFVSKTGSRANIGHVTRVQSVKIGTNHQPVHKAREGSAVASDDMTSASTTRTRVGVGRVRRVHELVSPFKTFPQDDVDGTATTGVCCGRNDIALGEDCGSRLHGIGLSTSRECRT